MADVERMVLSATHTRMVNIYYAAVIRYHSQTLDDYD